MPNAVDPIVITAACSPIGDFHGAIAIAAAIERASPAPDDVDQVVMRRVPPAGFGRALIGCLGTRVLVRILSALKAAGQSPGIASLCIGGGSATAMAIELI